MSSARIQSIKGASRTRSVHKVEYLSINPQVVLKESKAALIHHRSLRPFGFEAHHIGECVEALTVQTGRRATVTFASKGVAALGIRAGAVCGAKVTVRTR